MTLAIGKLWDRVTRYPGGKRLFSWLVGRAVPYTGTISPEVLELAPGYARVRMRDRRAVRNHLNSIHAIALINLGEFTGGLAVHYALPGSARAIVTHLAIEYRKKARGPLVAEARLTPPSGAEDETLALETVLRDAGGEVVAVTTAQWKIGPVARKIAA